MTNPNLQDLENLQTVIPAKAGIHVAPMQEENWIPAFAGMTK